MLKYAEAAFPNLVELLTFKSCLLDGEDSPNFEELSRLSDQIKSSQNWLEQTAKIAHDIIGSGNGPKYFLITAAEKGVVYIDEDTVEHYDIEENVNWAQVGDAVPCHVNGCGDTLASGSQ